MYWNNSLKLLLLIGLLEIDGRATVTEKNGRNRNLWVRKLKFGGRNYYETALELHNSLREDHSSPPLKVDKKLEAAAQATAEAMVNSEGFEGLQFARSLNIDKTYSQNVLNISDEWLAKRLSLAVLWAISDWYDPATEYDYTNPTPSSFTRLIWKSSTDFGLGLARNGSDIVIVANYAPPSEDVVTPKNLKMFNENVMPDQVYLESFITVAATPTTMVT